MSVRSLTIHWIKIINGLFITFVMHIFFGYDVEYL